MKNRTKGMLLISVIIFMFMEIIAYLMINDGYGILEAHILVVVSCIIGGIMFGLIVQAAKFLATPDKEEGDEKII